MHWSKALPHIITSRAIAVTVATVAFAPVLARSQMPPAAPAAHFVVVLDAAHGGDDSGGHLASGQYEKAATLAFSVRLRSLLNARGIPVITTRESDITIDANRRAEMANHANAQACLNLHVTESGSGIHLFTSSLEPSTATRFVAWKTAQAGWITRSLALAGALNSSLQQAAVNVTLSRTALIAVDSMTCPAAAVEIAPARGSDGKVSAEPDDPDYQARIAGILADAVLAWRTEGRQP